MNDKRKSGPTKWQSELVDVLAAWMFNIGLHIRWSRILCNEGDHRACWHAPTGVKEVSHAR